MSSAPTGSILARVYAPTGMLGSGFLESSVRTALAWKPDVIACDAGSTDGGPHYLATGTSMFGRASTVRDMTLLLQAAGEAKVPLIFGSAGTGGGDQNLAWARDCLREAAVRAGRRFRLATIASEQRPDEVADAMRAGRVRALPAAPNVREEDVRTCDPVVAMMGTAPIRRALDDGAEVILAGRASDAALFAAVPLARGVAPGPAWHAAKVLECGAAAVTHRTVPDGMFAWLEEDAFTVAPPHDSYRCTPQSVAAHALYENADPYRLTEPSGVVDLREAHYEAVDDRSVRVYGTRFEQAAETTYKLEGVRLRGYRSLVLGAVRDPFIVRRLDDWLGEVRATAERRLADAHPDVTFELVIREYGRRGVLGAREPQAEGAHEVLLAFEVTAEEATTAHAMANDVRHIALHHPIPEWHGLITALAHPHSPGVLDVGPAYEFALHHVLQVDDPLAPFRTRMEEVSP